MTLKKTLKGLAQDALDVQNACNLCGIAQSFAQAMIDLGEYCPQGTQERNTHPITRVWLDKLNSLAGIQHLDSENQEISRAFDYCYLLVNTQ